jgi:hypothetical protein
MSDFIMTRQGADLLELLQQDCGLSPDGAREFVEERTGLAFDPAALYGVGYGEPLKEKDWCYEPGLKVWWIGPGPA